MHKFKKGDKVKAISDIGILEKGKIYEVKRLINDDAIEIGDKGYVYLECEFEKAIKIKRIKKLTDMEIINARSEVNAEKINEIIEAINKLSKICEEKNE